MLFFASFGAKIAVFPINFFDYTKKIGKLWAKAYSTTFSGQMTT